jgi:hypothetical protein
MECGTRGRPGRFLPGRERSHPVRPLFLPGVLRRMACIVNTRRSTMTSRNRTPLHALARFALAAGACAAAAALWAGTRPEQGLLLDAQAWQDEVVTASTGPWPEDGWYRLLVQDQGVDVRAVKPSEGGMQSAEALFFRMKGTVLKTGLRSSYGTWRCWRRRAWGATTNWRWGACASACAWRKSPPACSTPSAIKARPTPTCSVRRCTHQRARGRGPGRRPPPRLPGGSGGPGHLPAAVTRAQPGPNLPTAELPAHGC